jgi:putative resolvase
VNLMKWAHAWGVQVTAACRWYREGALPVPAWKAGRLILVSPGTAADPCWQGGVGLYARVSSPDLGRRVARLPSWAGQVGLPVLRAGAGPGMTGAGARARRLLVGPAATVPVVGHRDRLGRMNTERAEAALAAQHRRLVVLGNSGVTGGLARPMIGVPTRQDHLLLAQ